MPECKWSPSVFSILPTRTDLQTCFNHLWWHTIAVVMWFAIHVGIYSRHLSSVLHGCLGCSWPGIRHKTRTSCVLRRLSEEPLLKEQKCSCLLNEARSSVRKSFWLLKLYLISHIVCQPLLSHRLTDHHLAAIVCGRYQLITSIQ